MITATGPLPVLHEELKRRKRASRDLMADTRLVSLAVADTKRLNMLVDLDDEVHEFPINQHAHGQISTHLDVPRKLYDRLHGNHPDLLRDLVNGLFSREPSKRRVRLLDGNVRAFLSDAYRPRDNYDLMNEALLPVLDEFIGSVEIKKCDLTETQMYVKVVLTDMEKPVTPKVGDVVRGGLIVKNSEVGAGSLGIYPYTDRLWCTNGAVHTEFGKRQRHVGKRIEGDADSWELYSDETIRLDDEAFFAKCRDVMRSVLNESVFDLIVANMQELAGIKVAGAPDKVVEVLVDRCRFRETERDSIFEKLVAGADLSGWGYVNAITETARDLKDADRQTELETIAGELIADRSWALAAA